MCDIDTRAHARSRPRRIFSRFALVDPGMVRADHAHMGDPQNEGFCAALLSRVEGDVAVFGELCDIFLDDAPKRLAAIRAALDAADAPGVQAAAHAFKGAAGVFDAQSIVAAARRLEVMGEAGNLDGGDVVFGELESFSRTLIDEIRASRAGTTWKS